MTILRAGFFGSHVAATSVFLAALVVLFCGFAYQIGRLVLGTAARSETGAIRTRTLRSRHGRRIVAAVLAIVSTFYLPGPLLALIRAATQVVWGGA